MALFISDEEEATVVTNTSETEKNELSVQGSINNGKKNIYQLKNEDENNATKIVSDSNRKAGFMTEVI